MTTYGIDLGTTYSSVAYIDDHGEPSIVPNSLNSASTTPSVVFFESADNVVVGQTAKDTSVSEAESVVALVKRDMGLDRNWEFHGKAYTPESISAVILRSLADDASLVRGDEVSQVVITVPAYFGIREKQATRDAGAIAGLDVKAIIPEPVAAALHYGVTDDAEESTILVYDLGGGTFDTTVLRSTPGRLEVLVVQGDHQLGGADWDDRLKDILLEKFAAEVGEDTAAEAADDEAFLGVLFTATEQTKKQLTQAMSRPVSLFHRSASARVEVTREEFEEHTRDLLDRTVALTRTTLEDLEAKAPGTTIDTVLLVGGSSRMPQVKRALGEMFTCDVKLHDPDLAVAKGAAVFAALGDELEWTNQYGDDNDGTGAAPVDGRTRALGGVMGGGAVQVITVLPKAIGVRMVDTSVDPWEPYVLHIAMPQQALPFQAETVMAATASAEMTEIPIELYEQAGQHPSERLDDNRLLEGGEGVIGGLPPLPKGSPVRIDLSIDEEGLIHLEAEETTHGTELRMQLQLANLGQEEVAAAKQQIQGLTIGA